MNFTIPQRESFLELTTAAVSEARARMLRGVAIAIVVTVLADAPRLQAQTPSVIFACVQKNNGQMRIVDASTTCRNDEGRIQWTVTAPQGPAGPIGPQGVRGPAGTRGPAGAAGSPGPQGPQGPAGEQGARGAAGSPGPQGLQGAPGAAGPKGATGDAGAAGAAGTPGPQGAQGASGAAGPQGAPGDPGSTGLAGPAGPAGPEGAAGPVGPKGPTGDPGAAGAPGAKGAMGDAGVAGLQGPQGPQGPSLQGPQGPAGADGPQGLAGLLAPSGVLQGTAACDGTPVPAGTLVYVPGRAFMSYVDDQGQFQFDHVPAGTYNVAVVKNGQNVATLNGVAVANIATNVTINNACAPVAPSNGFGGYCDTDADCTALVVRDGDFAGGGRNTDKECDSQIPCTENIDTVATCNVNTHTCVACAWPTPLWDPTSQTCVQCLNYNSAACNSTEYNLCNNYNQCECGENYECADGLVCYVNGYYCGAPAGTTIPGFIQGAVTSGGLPVAGATATLQNFPAITATTNNAGYFTLSNIPPGDYNVSVSLNGVVKTTGTVHVFTASASVAGQVNY